MASAGSASPYDNIGTARGQAWVDIVGPGLTDPSLPGPPDGLLDLVQLNSNSPAFPAGAGPGAWTIGPVGTIQHPCLVFRREADGSLTEMAAAMSAPTGTGFGLEYPGGSPWGIAAGDTDADGDTDLMIACGGFNMDAPNAVLRNNGDGTFTYNTPPGAPRQASFVSVLFDPDRDGDLDLYVGNGGDKLSQLYGGTPNPNTVDRFYLNDGTGNYSENTEAAGLALKSSTFTAVTADLDLDGDQDLVVSCFKQLNKVFYSNGDGTFSFMRPEGSAAGSPLNIADLSPDPDFAGSEEFPPGYLSSLVGTPILGKWSMPVEAADFNGDGWIDLFFGSWSYQIPDTSPLTAEGSFFGPYERAHLYLNIGDVDGDGTGEGIFNEVATEVGIDHVGGTMGAVAGDFNADGWVDLFVGGGGPDLDAHVEEDYLYINEPSAWPDNFLSNPFQPLGKAFYEVGAVAGTYLNREMSHGVNIWRSDSGRIDLSVGNGGPALFDLGQINRYFRNDGNGDGSFDQTFGVTVNETSGAPAAFGTRVELIRDGGGGVGQTLVLEKAANHGFSSQTMGPMAVGGGGAKLLASNVHWASGRHSGRLHWPAGPTSGDLEFDEPEISVHLTRRPQTDGKTSLGAEVVNYSSTTTNSSLLLAALLPQAQSVALGPVAVVVPFFALQPGEDLSLAGTVPNLPTGLYVLVLASWADGSIQGVSSIWHEPMTAPGPPQGLMDIAALEPERRFEARGELTVQAQRLRLAAQSDKEPGRELTASDRATIELPGGDRLTWDEGRLTLEVFGHQAASLQVEPDGKLFMIVGGPTSCCEIVRLDWISQVVLEGVDESTLRVDGRSVMVEQAQAAEPSTESSTDADSAALPE
ncbi:FG-GAP repeat domain-containing protein [Engelhardtia mirabilis]